jgi:hypothetical protein
VNGANGSFIEAIRGPVLMITLGVLFAVDYAGGLPFSRTWPVLIIVAGLFSLLQYAGGRKT